MYIHIQFGRGGGCPRIQLRHLATRDEESLCLPTSLFPSLTAVAFGSVVYSAIPSMEKAIESARPQFFSLRSDAVDYAVKTVDAECGFIRRMDDDPLMPRSFHLEDFNFESSIDSALLAKMRLSIINEDECEIEYLIPFVFEFQNAD